MDRSLVYRFTSAEQRPLGRRTLARCAGAITLTMILSLQAQAQGKDDLWEVTMKMEMAGMPMAIPPQTTLVCTPKNAKDEDTVPRQDNCKMLESKRTGDKLAYKMACAGKDAMSVTGEITYGSNGYEGKSVMTGQVDGRPTTITQTFSGKRVRDCTAPAK